MPNQILFYEQAVAVSPERHGGWSVQTGGTYAFARHTNAVPVMAVEFAQVAREYPIVFAGAEDNLLPIAVLGLGEKENTYITDEGGWDAQYIPAFVRRYPFVFATADDGKTFTLCIDEGFAGCNQEGRGERLFDESGKRTDFVERVLGFLQEYERQYQLTRLFTGRLGELGLLEPMQANVAFDSGEKRALTGFQVVSRERLKALPGATLSELARQDLLELGYLHLHSLNNFGAMVTRASGKKSESGPASPPPSDQPSKPARTTRSKRSKDD